ncbi:hypothetical protein ILYODFUR_004767 [Ilyodon furcidens]|uniref:Uncharacterized protein n=1 Tax=Ilyodon furcidens TaxID=33524 RepID=A0ABV0UP26_9TELE
MSTLPTQNPTISKCPTVDLVTVAIFTPSSSINSSSSSLDLSHALSTSNIWGEGNLSQHIVSPHSLFHLPPANSCRSKQVFHLPRTLLNSNLRFWHNRQVTCDIAAKYISYRQIFLYIFFHFPCTSYISSSPSLVQP